MKRIEKYEKNDHSIWWSKYCKYNYDSSVTRYSSEYWVIYNELFWPNENEIEKF